MDCSTSGTELLAGINSKLRLGSTTEEVLFITSSNLTTKLGALQPLSLSQALDRHSSVIHPGTYRAASESRSWGHASSHTRRSSHTWIPGHPPNAIPGSVEMHDFCGCAGLQTGTTLRILADIELTNHPQLVPTQGLWSSYTANSSPALHLGAVTQQQHCPQRSTSIYPTVGPLAWVIDCDDRAVTIDRWSSLTSNAAPSGGPIGRSGFDRPGSLESGASRHYKEAPSVLTRLIFRSRLFAVLPFTPES